MILSESYVGGDRVFIPEEKEGGEHIAIRIKTNMQEDFKTNSG
jgi:hypothetical protein